MLRINQHVIIITMKYKKKHTNIWIFGKIVVPLHSQKGRASPEIQLTSRSGAVGSSPGS